jgi:hypothetical protein
MDLVQLAHTGSSGRKQLAHAEKACSAGVVFFLIYFLQFVSRNCEINFIRKM